MTQAEICRAIGLDQAVLCRFMQGKSGLSVQNLDALGDLLGLTLVARGPVRVSPQPKHRPKPKKGTKP
jgi:transcriptional regulator with XRE-family HTH domain